MPVEGDPSEPLRSLLEFESQQHHLPIRFRKTDLRRGIPTEDRFEPIRDIVQQDRDGTTLQAGRCRAPDR